MEYKIIRASGTTTLCTDINKLLKNGWELVGGVSYDSKNCRYIQAVVKHKKDE